MTDCICLCEIVIYEPTWRLQGDAGVIKLSRRKCTWGTHTADERGCEALSSHENTRNPPEIIKITDLENEPEHVWRLPEVSRLTRDDI